MRPKKYFGQHFLINTAIASRIVNLLDIEADDQIIEIGPGTGSLTKFIQQNTCRKFILLEKDRDMLPHLSFFNKEGACLVNIDALTFYWKKLSANWKIIGNLPYNIASPLIWDMVSQYPNLKKAVFMVQKEVAQRICAQPDNKNYGALSVWTQCHIHPQLNFFVSPGNFNPPPKVDSAVISFMPKNHADLPKYPHELKFLLRICFQQRRKQLKGIFKNANVEFLSASLEKLKIDPARRPENLSCANFCALSEILARDKHPGITSDFGDAALF